jgi:hypothetical protein
LVGLALKKCEFKLLIGEKNIAEAELQGDWLIGNVVPLYGLVDLINQIGLFCFLRQLF